MVSPGAEALDIVLAGGALIYRIGLCSMTACSTDASQNAGPCNRTGASLQACRMGIELFACGDSIVSARDRAAWRWEELRVLEARCLLTVQAGDASDVDFARVVSLPVR